MAKKIPTLLIMLGMFGGLGAISGCNIVAGVDIERGGEAVRDSARDVQRKM